jgi:histidine ammonia-lyase
MRGRNGIRKLEGYTASAVVAECRPFAPPGSIASMVTQNINAYDMMALAVICSAVHGKRKVINADLRMKILAIHILRNSKWP